MKSNNIIYICQTYGLHPLERELALPLKLFNLKARILSIQIFLRLISPAMMEALQLLHPAQPASVEDQLLTAESDHCLLADQDNLQDP
jgi:hypothetical protein